ncbi:hypothetical protein FOZ63_000565 [Perkinsus olseni]|uniref:Uncharacterized protein n=1 Tax=Perkinsus olseni TaxID=32597 RepID=A0A7J6TD08_PEROL|nr:hypothetical protein FOZ62_003989 [Perkinsus olseni]KAF4743149.1 hypothetical protein FOZ63_000565 [Perkinsus olseni]
MAPPPLPQAVLIKHKKELQASLPTKAGVEQSRYLVHQLFPLVQKILADCLEDMPDDDHLVRWMIAWLELESRRRAQSRITATHESKLLVERGQEGKLRAMSRPSWAFCRSPEDSPAGNAEFVERLPLPLVAGEVAQGLWRRSFIVNPDGSIKQRTSKLWYEKMWERQPDGPLGPYRRPTRHVSEPNTNIVQAMTAVSKRVTNLMANGRERVKRVPEWWRGSFFVRRFSSGLSSRSEEPEDLSRPERAQTPEFYSTVGIRRLSQESLTRHDEFVGGRGVWVAEASDVIDSLGMSSSRMSDTSSLRVEEGSRERFSGSHASSRSVRQGYMNEHQTIPEPPSTAEESEAALPGVAVTSTSSLPNLRTYIQHDLSRWTSTPSATRHQRNRSTESSQRVVDSSMFKSVRSKKDALDKAMSVIARGTASSSG